MKTLRLLIGVSGFLVLASCTFVPTALIECVQITSAGFEFNAEPADAVYSWSFGDGVTSDQRSPIHTYAERGIYTVSLRVYKNESTTFAHMTVAAGHDWTVGGDLEAAIATAEPGDTLFVTGEQTHVTITKEVQIIGRGAIFTCLLYRNTAGSLEDVDLAGDEISSALTLYYSDVTIKGCSFDRASTEGYGGAVYAEDSRTHFEDCIFQNNSALLGGGAVYAVGSTKFPTFTGCRFATNYTGGVGGGILIREWLDETLAPEAELPEITDCTFLSNTANGKVAGGAIHIGNGCRAILLDNTFSGNRPEDVVMDDQCP